MASDIKYERQVDEEVPPQGPGQAASAPPPYTGPTPGEYPPYTGPTPGAYPPGVYPPSSYTGVPHHGHYAPNMPYAPQSAVATTVIVRAVNQNNISSPPTYLAWSIISTLFCTLFGIIAIIKSAQVPNLMALGDYAGARRASNAARNWNIAALTFGTIIVAFVIILNFVILSAGDPYDGY